MVFKGRSNSQPSNYDSWGANGDAVGLLIKIANVDKGYD